MFIQKTRKKITANDDINNVDIDLQDTTDDGEVVIEPEATDLLFEAEDVAELLAEATGETVEVSVEDDSVEFAVGEDVFTVEAEGDEEILEASSSLRLRGKRQVAASTRRTSSNRIPSQRRVSAASSKKVIRKVPVTASDSSKVPPKEMKAKISQALKKAGYDLTVTSGEDKFGYPCYKLSDGTNVMYIGTWDSGTDERLSVEEVIQDALEVARKEF